MNKVILMGRLTRDPEVRYSQSANPMAVVKYGIAVRRSFVREGEPDVDFFDITAFGKSGEFAEKYFRKGQMVSVVGRLQLNSWEDQQNVKRISPNIIVDEQHFAESRVSAESRGVEVGGGFNSSSARPSYSQSYSPEPTPSNMQGAGGFMPSTPLDDDEDLPF